MNIFLGIMAVIILAAMMNDKERTDRLYHTLCFVTVILGMVLINLIPKII
jgi:ABC-type sugar transport system permease subunit